MKHRIALFLAISSIAALAQPVQVQVILRSPAPGALPAWASDPSIVQVVVRNTTPTLYDGVVVSFVIRRLPVGNIVARSKDFHPRQPRFSLPPNGTLILSGPQIIHESAIKYEDESLRQQTQATGQLPEGEYEFCVRLLDGSGRELGATGALCSRTVVMLPDPPMLIHPRNDSTLAANALPMFVWAPVTGSPVPITYTLRVVPLFPGQAPQDALNLNTPVLNVSGLVAPLYQYVPTDIPLTAFPVAVGFVWQVSAVDQNGQPATRNNGKSEIFRFTIAPRAEEQPPQQTDTLASGRSSRPSGALTTAPANAPIEGNDRISRVALPNGFVLVLGEEVWCTTSTCTISGRGSLYIPLLDDSVRVTFDGITISRPPAGRIAALLGGTITIPIGVAKPMGLITLFLHRLTITSTHALLDGSWVAQWDRWGWACRTADSVSFAGMPFFATGLRQAVLPLTVPWTCDGNGLLIGECVALRLDTLEVQVSVDTAQVPPYVAPILGAVGDVILPCLTSNGMPAGGRIRLRLDRGTADLITIAPVRLRHARVEGMPQLRLEADTLVLDLSGSVNAAHFPPPRCCSSRAWYDPRWRGVVVPTAGAYLEVEEDTLHIPAAVILDQGVGKSHRVSLVGTSDRTDTLTVSGFYVRTDSVTAHLCQGTLQSITAEGVMLPPAGGELPRQIFDSIRVCLSAYDDGKRWRWNTVPRLLQRDVVLSAGGLVGISLRNPVLESSSVSAGNRRGYLQFDIVEVHIPAVNPQPHTQIGSIRIWNTGEIEPDEGVLGGAQVIPGLPSALVGQTIATSLTLHTSATLTTEMHTDNGENLLLELRNTGTQEIPIGTAFDVHVGVYVEQRGGERFYRVERQYFQLPQRLSIGGMFLYRYPLWIPHGYRVIGLWASIVPRSPLMEDDGIANNTVSNGELPPYGARKP